MVNFKRNKGPTVRVQQGTYQKVLAKKLLSQLMGAFFIIALIYLSLTATVLRFVPIVADDGKLPGGFDFVLAKNSSFNSGVVPAGKQALITLDSEVEIKDTILDNLSYSISPQKDTAVVTVLAGPAGKIQWAKKTGAIAVNGSVLPLVLPEDPGKKFLVNEYIATCVSGNCQPGATIWFQQKQLYGVTVAKRDFNNDPDLDEIKDVLDEGQAPAAPTSTAPPTPVTRPSVDVIFAEMKKVNPTSKDKQLRCSAKVLYKSKFTNQGVNEYLSSIANGGGQVVFTNPADESVMRGPFLNKTAACLGMER
jgi:hypothetical protein